MRFVHVVGVRPNFMKIAPIMSALGRHMDVEQLLVHTGQHYDARMSQVFFDDLDIPRPDVNLGLGSAQHESQTGTMMVALERLFTEVQPDCVVVVGDVNSTMAAALVSAKLGIMCAHVEAGLRSFDRSMPEEINRLVTDRVADLLLTPSADADENLSAEGVPETSIHRVGNVMIDTLLSHLDRAKQLPTLDAVGVEPGAYALVTLHRPSNVDDPVVLRSLLAALEWVQDRVAIVFPLHPRTRRRLEEFSLLERAAAMPNVDLTEPLGYLDFLALTASAKLVLTDSGGLQEETTVLGIPCLTLRSCTERPVTVSVGTNTVVGSDPQRIQAVVREILAGRGKTGSVPELWDGRASQRAADVLIDNLKHRSVHQG
ncbi:MAG: UDP-N-acetylglucosamine 2-epimerase (non-hydrolyzing) [Deltaproteobacteria bacterium]|nr:UDP-N-acetylglucosamine 2-epimerase (non-hydrolyzing) [Deltaproteobacteria bacterium]